MPNRKTLGVLMIAIVCGLGAMLASSKLLPGSTAEATPETHEVLVAARDLNAEEVLKPDMFKKAKLLKAAVPPGACLEAKDLEDRWVQIKTLEGEPLVERKLAPKGTPMGMVARIPKGKRAFALNVNEQSGVSGFILPDHHVDVIQVKPAVRGEPDDRNRAETVLEDLLVLASGTTFTSPTDRSILSKTVTVAVTADEAETLTAAQSRGQLSLALRGLNDHAKGPPRPRPTPATPPAPPPAPPAAPVVAVEPKPEPPVEVVAAKPKVVTIYRGGKPPESIRLGRPIEAEEDDGEGLPPATRLPRVRP